jgi:hypothetical protein
VTNAFLVPDLWRPIEDGSNTQYRLAVIESLIPPHKDGPIFHFHEMHDEGFYVTVGGFFFFFFLTLTKPRYPRGQKY